MSTEKQFIEVLKKIKEYCRTINCGYCKFNSVHNGLCQMQKLTKTLNTIPMDWNIKEIEELIND